MGNKQPEDLRKRKLKVLRLSLKQNCNFSCIYCKPENYNIDVLNIEQFKKLIFVSCKLGINSLRITGGEPLLSSQLVELLNEIRLQRVEESNPISHLQDISLTTNGYLLSKKKAMELFQNGLDRITVSLDAIDPDVFSKMIGEKNKFMGKEKLFNVLEGIDHAINAGFIPKEGKLKINAVIKKDVNDNQIFKLVDFAGWEMPISFSGLIKEHESVRSSAGLFDISHMGVISIKGINPKDYIQKLFPTNLYSFSVGLGLYTVMLNVKGGIIDDLIIYDLGIQ